MQCSSHTHDPFLPEISNAVVISRNRENHRLSGGGILGGAGQVVLALAADVAHVGVALRGRLTQTSRGASAGRDVAGDIAARADVDGRSIGRVEVALDGRLLGEGQVLLNLLDLVGLGLSHGDGWQGGVLVPCSGGLSKTGGQCKQTYCLVW